MYRSEISKDTVVWKSPKVAETISRARLVARGAKRRQVILASGKGMCRGGYGGVTIGRRLVRRRSEKGVYLDVVGQERDLRVGLYLGRGCRHVFGLRGCAPRRRRRWMLELTIREDVLHGVVPSYRPPVPASADFFVTELVLIAAERQTR